MENLDAIVATDGVHGIFIGPSEIESGIRAIVSAGIAAGILIADEALAKRYLELGCTFVAVGVDTSLFVSSTRALLSEFKDGSTPVVATKGSVY